MVIRCAWAGNVTPFTLLVCLFIQFFRDVAWEREILSLRVQCKKSERGCDWIGQLRHYEVTFMIVILGSVSTCTDIGSVCIHMYNI